MRRTIILGAAAALAIASLLAPPGAAIAATPTVQEAKHAQDVRAHALATEFTLVSLDRETVLYAAERRSKGATSKRGDDAQPVARSAQTARRLQRTMPLLL